ncbi:MAG: alanine dehydrogenase [Chlorobiaceae bacterium]|nr:alanine dehydrogenase [Chlorobiaceae bacterium]
MHIGIPKEIKCGETRVACTPSGVRHLVSGGHRVVVQSGAGESSGFGDDKYRRAGAVMVKRAAEVWWCDLVVKVKEPLEEEYGFFRKELMVFTYLHLAGNHLLAKALLASGVTGLAYETVEDAGRLPLLAPMSEIAGKMSVLMGSCFLAHQYGGSGILLGGVPGVLPARVTILGGGSAGMQAARAAAAFGADVTVLELDHERMRYLESALPPQVHTLYSTEQHIEDQLSSVDLLVGAVLVPGAAAPRMVTRDMLSVVKRGAVFVDIAIDQGGCFDTSKPTTHDDPVFVDEGIIHYCVGNMPAAYPRTSTEALSGATLPYIRRIADLGFESAMVMMPGLAGGLNVWNGTLTHKALAGSLGLEFAGNPFL